MSSHHTDIDSWPEPSAHERKRVLVGSRLAHKPDRTRGLESTADTHLLHLMRFPARILLKILTYLNFKEKSIVRLVCRRIFIICASQLNSTFKRV